LFSIRYLFPLDRIKIHFSAVDKDSPLLSISRTGRSLVCCHPGQAPFEKIKGSLNYHGARSGIRKQIVRESLDPFSIFSGSRIFGRKVYRSSLYHKRPSSGMTTRKKQSSSGYATTPKGEVKNKCFPSINLPYLHFICIIKVSSHADKELLLCR